MPWKAGVSKYRGACEETQSRACLLKLSCPLTAEDSGDPLWTRLLCLQGPYQAWQARVDCATQPLGHPSSQMALPSTTDLQKAVRSPWASGSGGAVLCSFPFCVLELSPPTSAPQGGTPLHFLWDYRPCLWLSWNLVLFETVKPGPCGVSQPQWAVLPFMAASPCSTRSPVTASKNNSACSFHYKLN